MAVYSTIIWYVKLILNKYSLLFLSNKYPMECSHFILLLLLLRILIKEVGIETKFFKAYISTCILSRAMKFSIQAL